MPKLHAYYNPELVQLAAYGDGPLRKETDSRDMAAGLAVPFLDVEPFMVMWDDDGIDGIGSAEAAFGVAMAAMATGSSYAVVKFDVGAFDDYDDDADLDEYDHFDGAVVAAFAKTAAGLKRFR
jgi:hypothetical protein